MKKTAIHSDDQPESYWEALLDAFLRASANWSRRLQERVLRGLSHDVLLFLRSFWKLWAHKGQRPDGSGWRTWMILAGRGYGKTRAGAEWVSELARGDGGLRIALVGATQEDVRRVMIEGESGLLAVARPDERPRYIKSRGEVRFPSGAVAFVYSAAAYEKLRGPQHDHAWCDEVAKWRHAEECWDNLQMGLRNNEDGRVFVTTTPKPMTLLRKLIDLTGTTLVKAKTFLNHNLPEAFVTAMRDLYYGTRKWRQEMEGELLEDNDGALWTRNMLEQRRVVAAPDLCRVVVAVDPPASDHGDTCGIIVAGRSADNKAYVLADCSVSGLSPEGWARAVANAAQHWQADRVVAEGNQGGNMVLSTLRAADIMMPVAQVHARHGKTRRAEPVATLYESGKAFHAGAFPQLEDQMCGLLSGGDYIGPDRSPDRADALVWALTELMPAQAKGPPRISVP